MKCEEKQNNSVKYIVSSASSSHCDKLESSTQQNQSVTHNYYSENLSAEISCLLLRNLQFMKYSKEGMSVWKEELPFVSCLLPHKKKSKISFTYKCKYM